MIFVNRAFYFFILFISLSPRLTLCNLFFLLYHSPWISIKFTLHLTFHPPTNLSLQISKWVKCIFTWLAQVKEHFFHPGNSGDGWYFWAVKQNRVSLSSSHSGGWVFYWREKENMKKKNIYPLHLLRCSIHPRSPSACYIHWSLYTQCTSGNSLDEWQNTTKCTIHWVTHVTVVHTTSREREGERGKWKKSLSILPSSLTRRRWEWGGKERCGIKERGRKRKTFQPACHSMNQPEFSREWRRREKAKCNNWWRWMNGQKWNVIQWWENSTLAASAKITSTAILIIEMCVCAYVYLCECVMVTEWIHIHFQPALGKAVTVCATGPLGNMRKFFPLFFGDEKS